MTEAEARERLERKVAHDIEPILSAADVDDLLEQSKRPDAAGLSPSDPDWTPTFDVDAGAALGWEVKAGRASAAFDFGEDGQRFNRSQMHEQCMAMAVHYRRGSASAPVRSLVRDVQEA